MNWKLLGILLWILQVGVAQDTLPKAKEPDYIDELDDLDIGVKGKLNIIPSVGYLWQWDSYLDANVILGDVVSDYIIFGHSGVRIGVESNLRSGSDFVIAPKVGYEVSQTIVVMRLSVADYIQGEHNELRLIPEFGITLASFIDLTYGEGIRLTKSEVPGIGGSRFGICINLSKILFNEAF